MWPGEPRHRIADSRRPGMVLRPVAGPAPPICRGLFRAGFAGSGPVSPASPSSTSTPTVLDDDVDLGRAPTSSFHEPVRSHSHRLDEPLRPSATGWPSERPPAPTAPLNLVGGFLVFVPAGGNPESAQVADSNGLRRPSAVGWPRDNNAVREARDGSAPPSLLARPPVAFAVAQRGYGPQPPDADRDDTVHENGSHDDARPVSRETDAHGWPVGRSTRVTASAPVPQRVEGDAPGRHRGSVRVMSTPRPPYRRLRWRWHRRSPRRSSGPEHGVPAESGATGRSAGRGPDACRRRPHRRRARSRSPARRGWRRLSPAPPAPGEDGERATRFT